MATIILCSLLRSISPERLGSYRLYAREPEQHVFERYFWNLSLAKDFYPLLQNLEIALRNNIHAGATDFYSNPYWFDLSFVKHHQTVYILKAKTEVAKEKVIPVSSVSPGAIIAELTFGFWVNIFNRPYTQFFLDVCIHVFRHAPKRYRDRDIIRQKLDKVRLFRNRVFHHEAIWNRTDLPGIYNDILELIQWIDPLLYEVTTKMNGFKKTYETGMKPLF